MPKANDLIGLLTDLIFLDVYCGVGANVKADFEIRKRIYFWLKNQTIDIKELVRKEYIEKLGTEWAQADRSIPLEMK